ncbi:MAG: thiamine phosphate synthase [Bacteroides sp.]|nr:thiamine phosphate synthase [Bacteroides sp.]
MKDEFRIIAITSPQHIPGEAMKINEILCNNEADLVHIRKPLWTEDQTIELLQQISPEFYNRIKLHDHFSLLQWFPLLGIHLNSRNSIVPKNVVLSVSCSFHNIDQLVKADQYDYVTLSPIFDSISKSDYRSAFSLSELAPYLNGKRVIALGGVTPDKFEQLKNAGFAGAAMLGYFWN